MNFDQIKSDILTNLGVVDYSPKGSVDHQIIPLINLINKNHDIVTTSSCAGRVSVFVEGDKSGTKVKVGGKGLGGHWLFVTHDPKELVPQWRKGLDIYKPEQPIPENSPKRYVLYKFEPLILHVKCRDLNTACKLLSLAMFCGFRESGIGPNLNVAIRTSMRIDAPIGYLKTDGIVKLATPEYLAELDSIALDMFEKNKYRIQLLEKHISEFETKLKASPVKKESKEERANRMKAEGLQRQQELILNKPQSQPQPQLGGGADAPVDTNVGEGLLFDDEIDIRVIDWEHSQ